MNYSYITNIPGCWESIVDLMSGNVSLIYYSHAITAAVSLLIGIFVVLRNKELINKILSFLCLSFFIWLFINSVSWLNCNSIYVSAAWSFFAILYSLIPIISFYFFYVFLYKKDVTIRGKIILMLPLLPMFFVTLNSTVITAFNAVDSTVLESSKITSYYYSIGFLIIFLIPTLFLINLRNLKGQDRKLATLMTIGIEFFLITFYSIGFLSDYFGNYGIEFYGLFGIVVFLAILAYLIVKFKAFDIKLIGSQALVWALVILIGSQFFFVETLVNQILVGVTLVLSAIVGLIIVRSVKKEIAQREELAVANENQQLLIRFITHQVKGFFTKSKMVFASIIEGDLGVVSEPVMTMAKQGLESDNKAVDMVQEVLKASSLRSGTMTYSLEETNINEFIGGIAETFRDTAVGKNLQYEVNLPKEIGTAKIDHLQMTQVIKNLIDNSVKYTLTGFVHVNLKINSVKVKRSIVKTALFSVEDSGVGLSDGDKAKLFKEGGRGEESLKVNVNSTGYGLFIVKKIVEGHGGKIWAESSGRSHGTKFFVEIPLISQRIDSEAKK